MGVIRGGLLVIVSVALFLCLFATTTLLVLSWSLEYDNVKEELGSVIFDLTQKEIDFAGLIAESLPAIELYCENNTEFVFGEGGFTFSVPCELVPQGPDAIVEHSVNSFVEKAYYQEYDCGFWNCLTQEETPLFLISEKARDYWNHYFYIALIFSFVLSVLTFLLIEKKSNFPILLGIFLIIVSLPFSRIQVLLSLAGSTISGLLSIFFNQSSAVFWRVLVLGIIVLVIGLIFKVFKIGFKISSWFKKKKPCVTKEEVKTLVKQEVSKTQVKKSGVKSVVKPIQKAKPVVKKSVVKKKAK